MFMKRSNLYNSNKTPFSFINDIFPQNTKHSNAFSNRTNTNTLLVNHKYKLKHKPTPLNPGDFITIFKETNTKHITPSKKEETHHQFTYKKRKLFLANFTSHNNTNALPELKCKCQYTKLKNTSSYKSPHYETMRHSIQHKTPTITPHHLNIFPHRNEKHSQKALTTSSLNAKCVRYKESAVESVAGMKMFITKENQDSFLIIDKVCKNINVKVFAVFDGHGDNGTKISNELSGFLNAYYNNEIKDHFNNDDIFISCIKTSINKAVTYIKNKPFNTDYSGTTLNMVFLYSNTKNNDIKIITTNIGDSRSIAISFTNNNIIQLTTDHKPDEANERQRIEMNGGEVSRVNWANYGPFRVWIKGRNYPGLAMSRSIGDNIAKAIGVIHEPEVNVYNVEKENIKAVVLATDGVWEFMTNRRVRDIIVEYYKADDCKGAVKKIVSEARKLWEVNNKMGIDDITCIVLFFKK